MKGLLISQFSTEAGFVSGAIRYLSVSEFSHVDLVVPRAIAKVHLSGVDPITAEKIRKFLKFSDHGLLGARANGGVQLRSPGYAAFTRRVTVGCEVSDVEAAYEFAFAQIGKPYDFRAILNFFLHKLHRCRKFNADANRWFCDELNYEIYKAGGVQLLGTANPENLTPQMEYLSPAWRHTSNA